MDYLCSTLYWVQMVGLLWILVKSGSLAVHYGRKAVWALRRRRSRGKTETLCITHDCVKGSACWRLSHGGGEDQSFDIVGVSSLLEEQYGRSKCLPDIRIDLSGKGESDTEDERGLVEETRETTLLLHSIARTAEKLKQPTSVLLEYEHTFSSKGKPATEGALAYYRNLASIIRYEVSTMDISVVCDR